LCAFSTVVFNLDVMDVCNILDRLYGKFPVDYLFDYFVNRNAEFLSILYDGSSMWIFYFSFFKGVSFIRAGLWGVGPWDCIVLLFLLFSRL